MPNWTQANDAGNHLRNQIGTFGQQTKLRIPAQSGSMHGPKLPNWRPTAHDTLNAESSNHEDGGLSSKRGSPSSRIDRPRAEIMISRKSGHINNFNVTLLALLNGTGMRSVTASEATLREPSSIGSGKSPREPSTAPQSNSNIRSTDMQRPITSPDSALIS